MSQFYLQFQFLPYIINKQSNLTFNEFCIINYSYLQSYTQQLAVTSNYQILIQFIQFSSPKFKSLKVGFRNRAIKYIVTPYILQLFNSLGTLCRYLYVLLQLMSKLVLCLKLCVKHFLKMFIFTLPSYGLSLFVVNNSYYTLICK